MFPHRLTDIAGKSVMDAAVYACKFHFLGGRGGIRVVADYRQVSAKARPVSLQRFFWFDRYLQLSFCVLC